MIAAASALILSSLLAQAHQDVVRHQAHEADSHKPHEAISHQAHQAGSHAKVQKAPKHKTAHDGAKPHDVVKH
jgi:hypothetical protein